MSTTEAAAQSGLDGLWSDLEAWYPFDGTILDGRGDHHLEVLEGEPQFGVNRLGDRNAALAFSGTSAFVAKGIDIGNTSFSLQYWTLDPSRWFFSQGVGSNARGLHMGVDAKGMRCDYWGNDLVAPLSRLGGWTHWVVTHDIKTGTKSTWRNGACVASKHTTRYEGAGDFIVGRHFTGGGHYSGGLDDVGIWTRALTPVEIGTLFDEGRGVSYARQV